MLCARYRQYKGRTFSASGSQPCQEANLIIAHINIIANRDKTCVWDGGGGGGGWEGGGGGSRMRFRKKKDCEQDPEADWSMA